MIQTFGNRLARDLVEDRQTKETRRFPKELRRRLRMKLASVHAARQLSDLRRPPGNRLEAMKGDRKGAHSIRANEQWRIVFRFGDGNAYDVTVEDYHR